MSALVGGTTKAAGAFGLQVRRLADREQEWRRSARHWRFRQFFRQRWRELPLEALLFVCRLLARLVPGFNVPAHGRLYATIYRNVGFILPPEWAFLGRAGDGFLYRRGEGAGAEYTTVPVADAIRRGVEVIDLGHVGCHLIVTAGKNYVASCFDNTAEPENLKFHGFGSGATAAGAGDTALQTEYTTQYATDSVRPTGSQSHSTNTYTTIGTFTPDAAVTVTEWGLLSQAATGGGTLLDRQVFTGVALNGTGDSLQTTYTLTQS